MQLPKVGDSVTDSRTITEQDVLEFAKFSGDYNPIHIDAEYAAKTRFKNKIAHGMIAASMLTKLAGTKLPGPGSIYLSQTLKFKNPVYFGDTIIAELKVTNIREDKPIITLSTICKNQKGEMLLEGEATIFYEPIEG